MSLYITNLAHSTTARNSDSDTISAWIVRSSFMIDREGPNRRADGRTYALDDTMAQA
jgi:hypothetical protein